MDNENLFLFLKDFDPDAEQVRMSGLPIMDVVDKVLELREPSHPGMTSRHITLKKHLSDFVNLIGVPVYVEDIDDMFWSYFFKYCGDSGLCVNSINLICDQLSSIIEFSSYYGCTPHQNVGIRPRISPIINMVALTPDEVSAIYHLDLNAVKVHSDYRNGMRHLMPQHIRKLEKIRDMFVLNCNLGLRYSDMVRLNRSNFSGDIMHVVQQKTGLDAIVDINVLSIDPDVTRSILEKYDYHAPYAPEYGGGDITNYNKGLKEVFRYADIKQTCTIVDVDADGNVFERTIKKYNKISSHVARRTFCTVNVNRGLDLETIRKGSGHSSEDGLTVYIRYGRE